MHKNNSEKENYLQLAFLAMNNPDSASQSYSEEEENENKQELSSVWAVPSAGWDRAAENHPGGCFSGFCFFF